MNTIIQTILVFAALALAVVFLMKKFFWKKRTKANNSPDGYRDCGTDDCGCH